MASGDSMSKDVQEAIEKNLNGEVGQRLIAQLQLLDKMQGRVERLEEENEDLRSRAILSGCAYACIGAVLG
jgi:hypothetical protein